MANVEKTEKVAHLTELMKTKPHMIFADYRGLKVSQLTALRKSLRENNAQVMVAKNNLLKIAMTNNGYGYDEKIFIDPTAVVYSSEFPSDIAKKMLAFAKTNEALALKGAFIEGKCYTTDQVKVVAEMPSKQELISRLAFALNYPIQSFAGSLNAIIAKLAFALNAVAEKKGGAGQ